MDLELVSGSALCLVHLKEMSYKGEVIKFLEKQNYGQSKEVFNNLFSKLLAIRKGDSTCDILNDDWVWTYGFEG